MRQLKKVQSEAGNYKSINVVQQYFIDQTKFTLFCEWMCVIKLSEALNYYYLYFKYPIVSIEYLYGPLTTDFLISICISESIIN